MVGARSDGDWLHFLSKTGGPKPPLPLPTSYRYLSAQKLNESIDVKVRTIDQKLDHFVSEFPHSRYSLNSDSVTNLALNT